ncbi:hypothetical protein C0991_009489, partial [Blastosporella zonata]
DNSDTKPQADITNLELVDQDESKAADEDDDEDDGHDDCNDEDPSAALDEEDQEELLANTGAVCTVIFKVQKLSFSIINSTT